MMPQRTRPLGILAIALTIGGCATIFQAPEELDLHDPAHPIQLHQRMVEESLRQHEEAMLLHHEAHDAAMRMAAPPPATVPETIP